MSYYVELRSKDVTVSKDHPCIWCGELIEVGKTARYRVYTFDDEFASDWMHPECLKAMQSAPPDEAEDGWYPGEFKRGSIEEW